MIQCSRFQTQPRSWPFGSPDTTTAFAVVAAEVPDGRIVELLRYVGFIICRAAFSQARRQWRQVNRHDLPDEPVPRSACGPLPRRARSISSRLMTGGLRSVGLLGGSVEVASPAAIGSLAGKVMATALSTCRSFSAARSRSSSVSLFLDSPLSSPPVPIPLVPTQSCVT
jgi:hypothetical protein